MPDPDPDDLNTKLVTPADPKFTPPDAINPFTPRSGVKYDTFKHNEKPPDWDEIPGYRERGDESGFTATRLFRGPWNTYQDFRTWALGTCWSTETGILRRIIPAQHPRDPWLYAYACELIEGEGAFTVNPQVVDEFGQETGMIGFFDASTGTDKYSCKVAVHYRDTPYAVRSDREMADNPNLIELDRFITRSTTYSMQSLPLPQINGNLLKFAEGPAGVIDESIPVSALFRLFPMQELTYVWHMVPDVPDDAIATIMGHVNSEAFDVPRVLADGTILNGRVPQQGYLPGTLLMMTPAKREGRTAEGRVCWEITFKFLYRPDGWNKFPASDGNMYLAKFGGSTGTDTVYQPANFTELFELPNSCKYQSAAG